MNCFCSVWARTLRFLLGVETLRLFGYSDCFGASLSYLGCSGVLNLFSMFMQIWWLPRFTCFEHQRSFWSDFFFGPSFFFRRFVEEKGEGEVGREMGECQGEVEGRSKLV